MITLAFNIKKGLKIKVGEVPQIALVVKDIGKMMEKYWKTLGVGPWSVYTYAPPVLSETKIRGEDVNYSMRLALATIGSLQLELIEPLDGPSIYKEFLAEKGEGLHHIQTKVRDVDETMTALRDLGINILMSGKFASGEFYYMDSKPLYGVIIELVKRNTPRPPPEEIYPSD